MTIGMMVRIGEKLFSLNVYIMFFLSSGSGRVVLMRQYILSRLSQFVRCFARTHTHTHKHIRLDTWQFIINSLILVYYREVNYHWHVILYCMFFFVR